MNSPTDSDPPPDSSGPDDNWWSTETAWDHYGQRLVSHEAAIESLFGCFSNFAMNQSTIPNGGRALDIGCGCGATTVELANRVGPSGSVLGLDISEFMLERANKHAQECGSSNAKFAHANIENETLESQDFDFVFSRFGVMFFDDPIEAFRRIRKHMNPGGQLTVICWQPQTQNTWIDLHLKVIAPLIGSDISPPLDAHTGPFAFGDPERPQKILADSGFTNIRVTPFTPAVPIFNLASLDDFVDFSFVQLHAWFAMKERTEPISDEIRAALRTAFEPYHTERGVVLQSATWVVQAENART